MYIAVLTGPIGSGKSEALRILGMLGARTLSLDDIANSLLETDSALLDKIEDEFGPGVFDGKGAIDRAALADAAFSSAQRTEALNAITHPAILNTALHAVNQFVTPCISGAESPDMFVIEVPLPDHAPELISAANELLGIFASDELRLSRLTARGMTEEQAYLRMARQLSPSMLRQMCDTCIENDGARPELEEKLRTWYETRAGRSYA